MLALVVNGTDVHDNVTGIKNFGVSSTFDVYYPVSTVRYTTLVIVRRTCIPISLCKS